VSSITYVPYQQTGEPDRRAALVRVDFPLAGLSDEDIQVLGHLSEAVSLMNPVYRDQFEPKMLSDSARDDGAAAQCSFGTTDPLQGAPRRFVVNPTHSHHRSST
jgi:hypothetical protein